MPAGVCHFVMKEFEAQLLIKRKIIIFVPMQLKVTEELNQVIKYAREEAMRTGSYGIGPDHLFLGIIRQEENAAFTTLQHLGIEPADVKASPMRKWITSISPGRPRTS